MKKRVLERALTETALEGVKNLQGSMQGTEGTADGALLRTLVFAPEGNALGQLAASDAAQAAAQHDVGGDGAPSDAAAHKPLTGAEKAALYTENAAKCLAARDQAPSANRKRKPGSEAVDGGHFRSEANARKNAGKLKGEFKKRPERQRER